MAVLAHLVGVPKITLLPVDSRFLTLYPLNIDMKWIGKEWPSDGVPVMPNDDRTYKRAALLASLAPIINKANNLAQNAVE
jgi:hypothetical protein